MRNSFRTKNEKSPVQVYCCTGVFSYFKILLAELAEVHLGFRLYLSLKNIVLKFFARKVTRNRAAQRTFHICRIVRHLCVGTQAALRLNIFSKNHFFHSLRFRQTEFGRRLPMNYCLHIYILSCGAPKIN